MNHCFKTSHYFKFPLGLASRCGTPEWNFIHRNNQTALPTVPSLPAAARHFGSLCLAAPPVSSAPPLPAASPPQQLAAQLRQLSRQLVALEAVHQLQTTADLQQLRAAALSDTECRAFRELALPPELARATTYTASSSATGGVAGGSPERRMAGDFSPGSDSREGKPERGDRPTVTQLREIEANLLLQLPKLFVQTLDYTIYHKDLVFDNRIRGTKTVGIVPYIKQCALLRIVGHIKFSYVVLEVLQSAVHAEDDTVRVRWRIRGVSALKSMLMFWRVNVLKLKKSIDDFGVDWYDGYSIFQVGADGLIHTHIADKMMPDWSREVDARPALGGLAAVVYGLLPDSGAAAELVSQPLGSLAELGQLVTLAARLERLERQIETALPLNAAHFQSAGST